MGKMALIKQMNMKQYNDIQIEGALYQAPSLLPSKWRRLHGARNRAYFSAMGDMDIRAGITTVIGKSLPTPELRKKWLLKYGEKRLRLFADFGTAGHAGTNDFTMGRDWREGVNPKFRKGVERVVMAFSNALRKYNIKPENILLIETPVGGEINGCEYVGTVDYLFETDVVYQQKIVVDEPTGEILKSGKNKGQSKTKKETRIVETLKKEVWIWDLKTNLAQKEEKDYYEDNLFQLLAQKEAIYQTYGIVVDRIFNWSEMPFKENKGDNTYQLVEWVLEGNDFEGKWNHKTYKQKDIDNLRLYMRIAANKGFNIPDGKLAATSYVRDEHNRLVPMYSTITYEEYVEEWRRQKENKMIQEEMDSTELFQTLFIRSDYPELVTLAAENYAKNDSEWILKGYIRDIPREELMRLVSAEEAAYYQNSNPLIGFEARKDWFLLIKPLVSLIDF